MDQDLLKKNVKKLFLDTQFAGVKKYYLAKNYLKAELIFLNLKDLGYQDPSLFLYLANIYLSNGSHNLPLVLSSTSRFSQDLKFLHLHL